MQEEDYLFGRPSVDLNERKEVKVKLPIGHLIRLHGLKLLRGKTITDAVTEALDRYFTEQALAARGPVAEPASAAVRP